MCDRSQALCVCVCACMSPGYMVLAREHSKNIIFSHVVAKGSIYSTADGQIIDKTVSLLYCTYHGPASS